MLNNQKFLQKIAENVARIKRYKLGMDGTGGECDCIGLIIGALRLAQISWPWTHGSNYTARNRIIGLHAVKSALEVEAGDIVFKACEPAEDGWALPYTYHGHSDQRDYYHVGVVTGVSPLEITHCTSIPGAIKRDGALGSWRFAGKLDLVSDAGGDNHMIPDEVMAVYEVTGGRLALRSTPRKADDNFLRWIDEGERVHGIAAPENGWVRVEYRGQAGYCMTDYLIDVEMQPEEPADMPDADDEELGNVTMTLSRAAARELMAALQAALGGG